mgnify:CR=1 FL=1
MNIDPHIESLILRSLESGLSADEQEQLLTWRNTSQENETAFQDFVKIYKAASVLPKLDKLDTKAAFGKVISKQPEIPEIPIKRNPFFSPKNEFWKVAAVFLVLLGSVKLMDSLLFESSPETVIAWTKVNSDESKKEVSLPDGSIVTLAENSSLEYLEVFDKIRSVKLNGRAFFDVVRDEERAFVIEAGEMNVEVLGTSFQIEAFEESNAIEVLVKSGEVAFYHEGDKEKEDKKLKLKKGEKASYDKLKKSIKTVITKDLNELSWLTGKITFNKTQIDTVIKTLEGFFGVDIVIENQDFANCKLSASFDNQELDEIIEVIRVTYDVEVKQEAKTIRLIGKGC